MIARHPIACIVRTTILRERPWLHTTTVLTRRSRLRPPPAGVVHLPAPGQAGWWPACFATPRSAVPAIDAARIFIGAPTGHLLHGRHTFTSHACHDRDRTGAPLPSDHRIDSNSTRAGRSRGAHRDATAQHRSERASSIQKMMDHQVAQKFKTRISMLCLPAALLQGSCGVRRPHPNSDPPPASRRAASARPVRDQRQGRDASSGRASRAGSARDRVM